VSEALYASPFEGRVIFVLGSRRTGTTWLQELLLAHPAVVTVPTVEVAPGRLDPSETVIMGALEAVWLNAHNANSEGLPAFLEQDEIIAVMRRFCDSLFARARDTYNPGAEWFLEKSPSNIARLPLITSLYPDAWFIHVVRDGRDAVRSLMDTPMAPPTVADAAAEWVDVLDELQRYRHLLRRFRQVRYEAMLGDPVAAAADLFQWLGLKGSDDVLQAVEERSKRQVARFGATGPIGAGKWMELPAHERARVLDIAGDWLAELGYIDAG
jgi:Sulfotransferase family